MKVSRLLIIVLCLALLAVPASGCKKDGAAKAETGERLTLKAAATDKAPTIDGKTGDVWAKAPATKVTLRAQDGVEPKEITLKALYDDENLYLLATYRDATPLKIGEVMEFDGVRWQKGPYDDTLAFLWNINDSLPGFGTKGLDVMTTPLASDMDVFDFTIDDPGESLAAAQADFWGW